MDNKGKIKKVLVIAGILITTYTSGAVGDHYLIKDIDIGKTKITGEEFIKLKPEIAKIFKDKKITPDQKEIWDKVADKVVKDCGGVKLKNVSRETISESINNIILSGNCKMYE